MRQEVVEQLQRSLNAILSRRIGVAVGLHGEAGIGKTHAAACLLRALPCASLSLHATAPLQALVSGLPQPVRLPDWAEKQLLRVKAGGEVEAKTLVPALSATLAGLAPFALHLEDLHEADAERQALITALAGAVRRTPGAALLVTSRAPLPEPFLNHLLPPLDLAETRHVLQVELNAELPPEGQEWIQERSGGNPLFALEFLRYLTRQGALWSDGKRWHWRAPAPDFVPVSIQALIEQGIHHFGDQPQVLSVLEARAVLPGGLPPEALEQVWAQVAGCTPEKLLLAVQQIRQRGLLSGVDFAHPLFGEVVQAGLEDRRQSYAKRALDALETDFPELAAPLLDEVRPDAQRALHLLERARLAAEQRHDERQQAHWQAQAVRWLPPEARPQAALEAARALNRLGRSEALDYAEQAVTLPEGALLYAGILAAQGRIEAAEQQLTHLAGQVSQEQWWQIRLKNLFQRGLAQNVVQLWQEAPQWHDQASVESRAYCASALARTGDLDTAEQMTKSLLARADLTELDVQRARNTMGMILQLRGEKQKLWAFEQETIRQARSFHNPAFLALALLNHSSSLGEQLPRREVRPLLHEAKDLFSDLGQLPFYAVALLRLAREDQEDGQFEQAETQMLAALTILEGHDRLLWQTEAHCKLARLYLDWSPPPPHALPLALRHAQLALKMARTMRESKFLFTALGYAARAEARNGHLSQAVKLAEEALALGQAQPDRLSEAQVAYALALEASGQPEQARPLLGQACAGLKERGEELLVLRLSLELDRLNGDLDSARQHHTELLQAGYVGLARTAEAYFPSLQAAPQRPSAEPAAAPVRLKVLGPVVLERDGVPLVYRARKRLELLAYLLETRLSGRPEATTLDLLDACYPGEPEAQAQKTLRQQVYLIRGDLGAGSVISTPGGYALGEVGSDAEDFLTGGATGLWHGPYLEGLAEGWLPGVREALTQALRSRTETLLEDDPREAARLAGMLGRMEPYDADLLRLELRALTRCGDERTTQHIYRQRCRALLEVGQVLPERPADFVGMALA